jgi:5-hydroxyisourate hydrolase
VSLSTHVLDAARGRPATGVPVRWETRVPDGTWSLTAVGLTDADGRVAATAWQPRTGTALGAGRHRLVFDVETWAATSGSEVFFPEVTITFLVTDGPAGGHHHVPLLLSPYAYSTYRGS